MLTLFRMVFPAPFVGTPSFGCGSAAFGAGEGGTRLIVEGVLRPDRGVPGADLIEGAFGIPPVLLRVLLTGKAGRAILGGPRDGRDGRGKVVVMVMTMD